MADAQLQAFSVGGLDETNDDVFGPATSMRECRNAVFPDGMTAKKRDGLVAGASLAFGRKLLKRGGEALVTDGAALYGLAGNTTQPRGVVSPCMVERSYFATGNLVSSAPNDPIVPRGSIGYDAATGYSVRAWSNGLALAAQVVDEATGAAVTIPTVLNGVAGRSDDGAQGAVDQPRVCIVGSVAFVLHVAQLSPATVKYTAIDLTNIAGGWTAEAPLVNSIWDTTGAAWDAEVVAGSSIVALLTCVNANQSVNLRTYTASGTTLTYANGALAQIGLGVLSNCCAVRGTAADGITIFWSYFTGVKAVAAHRATYTTNVVVVQAPTAVFGNTWTLTAGVTEARNHYAMGVERVAGQGAGSSAVWMFTWTLLYNVGRDYGGGKTIDQEMYATYWKCDTAVTSGVGPVVQGPMLHFQLVSKPRSVSVAGATHVYMVAQAASDARLPGQTIILSNGIPDGNQTTFLVDVPYQLNPGTFGQTWTPAATTAVLSAGDLTPATFDLVAGPGSSLLATGTEVDEAKKTSLATLRFDFAHPALWQTLELGNWAWIAGGMPMLYDGQLACEVGFLTPPPPPMVKITDTTGGVTNNPVCQYVVVEIQQDAAGNVHRSAPSNVVTVNASAGSGAGQIQLVVFPRRHTLRQPFPGPGVNPLRLQIYRNTTATPTVFQLVGEIQNDIRTYADGIDFLDNRSDAAISTETVLYTTGGAVENDAPPSLSALSVHADRVMGVADDGRTMWFTTTWTPGECPRFSAGFTIPWPDGPLTATWSLEQRLSAATATRIWYVLGEGPTDTGTGSDWTTPQMWQSSVGVSDARGVGLFESGALLATNKGLYVHGRDGSLTWLTKPRKTAAANPVVTSILALTSDGVVRIACNATTTVTSGGATFTPGVVLHWDYRHDRWSTHVSAVSGGYTLGADDQVEVNGAYAKLNALVVFGTPAAQVSNETPGTSLDGAGSVWVPLVLTWGWVFTGVAMQGWGEATDALVLGRYVSPHTLSLSVARDYSASADPDPRTWDDATLTANAAGAGGAEQIRANIPRQTGEALSLSLEDSIPTSVAVGTGQGLVVQSLLLRSTPKRGEFHELPATAVK
jgi:hypothetical protein